MVRIQLENGYLDVKEGTSFPLNFSVGDIRDLSKRSGSYSKTIVLVGNKNNHELLGHRYDVNIEDGTFNINTITRCNVLQNDIPIMEDALLQLVAVNKVQMTDAYEQGIEYEVLVKDSQVEFYTAIANKELTDLDFSDLDHYQTSGGIVSTFNNTIADGYKYVLPYSTTNTNNYHIRKMKPAIYAKLYFDRIFSNAGFSYEWAGLSQARFDKLLIPYNGDENVIDWSDYKVKANQAFTSTQTQPSNGSFVAFTNLLDNWTETLDDQNIFNPLTGVYTAPTNTDPLASQSYEFNVNITYEVTFNNTSSNPVQPYVFDSVSGTYVPDSVTFTPILQVRNNGVNTGQSNLTPLTIDADLNPGVTTFGSYINTTTLSPSSYVTTGDLLTMRTGINSTWSLFFTYWRDASGFAAQVDVNINIVDIKVEIVPNSNTPVISGFLSMNEYVPLKIKQSDFVKSIFQMYNLYIEVDTDQPNKLIFQHRDEFYDLGAEKDWTSKLMKDKDQNLLFLPDVTNKKLKLTYKEDTDSPNEVYTQMTDEIYGQVEYTFENEYVKDTDTKELIFSPTPIIQTVFDAIVPMIDGQAPKTNIRILYDGGEQPCGAWNLISNGTIGTFNITTYPAITHFDDPLTPTFDINFGTCDYYFYNVQTLTANNLYNLYWRRTVNQINVGKMLTAYFFLEEGDIQSLKLNDKIRIDNSWWNINKVSDYDANEQVPTKVELISVDSEIDFAPFKTKPGKPSSTTTTTTALQSVMSSAMQTNNVILPGSNVAVYGTRNMVSQNVKGVIIGDDKTLNEDGIITPQINGKSVDAVLIQYNKYVANLSQVGTDDPTALTLENSMDDITWTRTATGDYLGTPSTPLDPTNTFVTIGNVYESVITSAYVNTDGNIVVKTYQVDGLELADTLLNYTPLEIRVYE